MSEVVVTATLVVLRSSVWQSELSAEFQRLGMDPTKAPAAAAKALQRIVGHHGWPQQVIQVASSDPDEIVEKVADDRAAKRSRSAARRRLAEMAR